jgi:hypothetical protein
MPTQVLKDGSIIPTQELPSLPNAIPQAKAGSHIQAAAASVNAKTVEQGGAINVLGGKIGGRRRKLRGGAEVIDNVPAFTSAGGVDPKQAFAKLISVQQQGAANRQFDGLGSAPPKVIPQAGGKKKTRKIHNGTRNKRRRLRKHRRSNRRTLRVRRTRN